jgi:uncharacterized cupredoxin-like copper-binding protein
MKRYVMNSPSAARFSSHVRRRAAMLSLLVFGAVVLVGCSSPASSAPGSTVKVTLTEWAIVVDKASVPAGKVTFDVTNASSYFKHEMVVLKTDLDPAALPADSTGKVDEESSVGEVPELDKGAAGSATLDLAAGKYVLICNIVESGGGHEAHYTKGMRLAFTVS